MKRLSPTTLDALPRGVARPAYAFERARVGVVHLGLGAFHRAHQAVYFDDRLAAGDKGWAILGASLRAPDVWTRLAPQSGLYTLATRSGKGEALRVIGALRGILVAPSDPEAVIVAMSDPAVRIVSLTVTEKGYCHDPATLDLQETHPDIRHDLATPRRPLSAPGFLVEALRRRRAAGVAPFAALSCDNLPGNGAVLKRVVTQFAALGDPEFGRWLADALHCPSTMVDRIVPATTEADRQAIASRLGVMDAAPVVTEPFSQWVIADDFPAGRPRFEDAGAILTRDVTPFETAKLRLLNGSHSTLAYLGALAGYETIAATVADPAFARLAREMMEEEAAPTLAPGAIGDVAAYQRQLLERFANPALEHRVWQIAMDGSQKLPQRLLGTIRDRLAAGAPFDRLALGVAAWMRTVAGVDEKGAPIDASDPLAARLRGLADEAGPDAPRLARALVGVSEVFGADLAADPRFLGVVTAWLGRLYALGARRTVAEFHRLAERHSGGAQ